MDHAPAPGNGAGVDDVGITLMPLAGATAKELPRLADYDDHRAFLRDWYAARKAREPRFSYRAFALQAGLPSPNHLKVVLDYGRPLTRRFLGHYAKGLRLSREETEELGLLAEVGNARGREEREAALARLKAWRTLHRYSPLQGYRRFGEYWKRLLVESVSGLKGFRADAAWISRRLQGRLTPAEVRSVIQALVREGSLRFRGGRPVYKVSGQSLDLSDPAMERELRRGFLLAALDFRGDRRGHENTCSAVVQLTREEAARLHRDLEKCILSHMPDPGRKIVGEVFQVISDVMPLTGPVGAKKRYARK